MTNYSTLMLAALVACATGTASMASSTPSGNPPAATTTPAAAPRYTQAAAGNSLTFSFVQADAANEGLFRQFSTELVYDEKNPAAGRLAVTVQIASLETHDKDRDDTLKSAELFDAQKYPTAQFLATSFAKRADGQLEAVGKLTLRGITRELRLPLALQPAGQGLELSGALSIRRLDYGVGQGDWNSTEWVGNEVKLKYKVALTRAP